MDIIPTFHKRKINQDNSQAWRRFIQILFFGLNVWIGLQFVCFVRYFESGGTIIRVSRPPGVEGWLPIAGLMNLKYLLATGSVPPMHPAASFLLIAFLSISILFRKSFCSWLCPIGTISETVWKFGRKLIKRNWVFPRAVDLTLRPLKYILLALFLYAVAEMPSGAIAAFLTSPYGLVADVKMLYFFRHLSGFAAATLVSLFVLSVFFQNFWCRYICPYGALMGLAAVFSPAKIRRNAAKCINCAQCSRACPALLRVDALVNIRSAECTGCMECVAVCPADGALQLSLPRHRRISPWAMAAGIGIILTAIIGFAKWEGSWKSDIPDSTYEQLIPQLDHLTHP
jgi:polyferredoxin